MMPELVVVISPAEVVMVATPAEVVIVASQNDGTGTKTAQAATIVNASYRSTWIQAAAMKAAVVATINAERRMGAECAGRDASYRSSWMNAASKPAAMKAATDAATVEASSTDTAHATAMKAASKAATDMAAATEAATTTAATSQRHRRRSHAESGNGHQRDCCPSQHHRSPH
jgi:hypothetical protein